MRIVTANVIYGCTLDLVAHLVRRSTVMSTTHGGMAVRAGASPKSAHVANASQIAASLPAASNGVVVQVNPIAVAEKLKSNLFEPDQNVDSDTVLDPSDLKAFLNR